MFLYFFVVVLVPWWYVGNDEVYFECGVVEMYVHGLVILESDLYVLWLEECLFLLIWV